MTTQNTPNEIGNPSPNNHLQKQQKLAERLQEMGMMPSPDVEETPQTTIFSPQEYAAQRLREMGLMPGVMARPASRPLPSRGFGVVAWVTLILGLPLIVILLYLSTRPEPLPHFVERLLATVVGFESMNSASQTKDLSKVMVASEVFVTPSTKPKGAITLPKTVAKQTSYVASVPHAQVTKSEAASLSVGATPKKESSFMQGQRWLRPSWQYYPPAYYRPTTRPHRYHHYPYPSRPYRGRTDS